MGLLEDAIREHLELKRRHGAPDQELERQEVEALGPARREMPGAEQAGGHQEPDLESRSATGQAAEEETALSEPQSERYDPESRGDGLEPRAGHLDPPHGGDPETRGALSDQPRYEQAVPPEPGYEPELADAPRHAHERQDAEAPLEAHEPEPSYESDESEPAFEDEPVRRGDTPPRGSEPVEHEPERAEGEEDVLEHTPEFLQETPEHDRLWFEQKPPRDFDFD